MEEDMDFKTATKWKVPYGTWIVMSHSEAHEVATAGSINALMSLIAGIGTYAAVAAAVVYAQKDRIHSKNKISGGKGVKVLFVWAAGMVMSIERRGQGSSPCC
jgi:hypothetical protein